MFEMTLNIGLAGDPVSDNVNIDFGLFGHGKIMRCQLHIQFISTCHLPGSHIRHIQSRKRGDNFFSKVATCAFNCFLLRCILTKLFNPLQILTFVKLFSNSQEAECCTLVGRGRITKRQLVGFHINHVHLEIFYCLVFNVFNVKCK